MQQTLPQAKYRKDYHAPDFTITHVALDIALDPHNTEVQARLTVVRQNPNATLLRLDGQHFKASHFTLNHEPYPHFTQDSQSLTIDLSANPLDEFELQIYTLLDPAANTALEGLYQSGDGLCTQCEAEGFRNITYMLDRPDVLAIYHVRLTADKARYPFLLSNGNRLATGDLEDGRHWVEWFDPFPKPCYLFALVAGKFDVLKDHFITKSGRDVALEIYVDEGNLDRAHWAMNSLKKAMKWDEERFGLEYDLDIYMIVAVDFFNMGAMENKGLNIFNTSCALANQETATDDDYIRVQAVIAHEYFHNWTGNRVTCRDWFQLSLKEGLTVFRDQEFTAHLWSRAEKRIEDVRFLRTAQFAEDASPTAHPIRPEKVIEMNNFYTVTVYEKGAEVIRMLHTLLGEALFQKGIQHYLSENDGKAATCEDFVRAMETVSGMDLTQFRYWYSQSGTPQLTITDHYDQASGIYRVEVSQFTPATADQTEKVALHIPLRIALYGNNGVEIPLQSDFMHVSDVLDVIYPRQIFEFHNVPSKPVPAFLCDFSAPVKLDYHYNDSDLITLLKHAKNEFVRWNAAQMLYMQEMRTNLHRYQNGQELSFSANFLAVLEEILLKAEKDYTLTRLLLSLPKETEFAEQFNVIDPMGIAVVHHFMRHTIAEQLKPHLHQLYLKLKPTEYRLAASDMARRGLRNLCLAYLAHTDLGNILVHKHFTQSDNMTDTIAALSAALDAELGFRDTLMRSFEEKWAHDGLVMDKWFSLQATRQDGKPLERVQSLLSHPSFNFNNPNRMRALVGAFAARNLPIFHATDGSGYRFLVDILTQLNQTNPQIASRLIEPLLKLSRFDDQRQTLMRRSLTHLSKLENLASDLFEKIEKALL